MPKPNTAANKLKCVCCNAATKKNKSHLVFDEYGKFRRIQFLLAECLNKKVAEVTGGQQSICVECLNQLDQNYAFKLKCTKPDKAATSEESEDSDCEQSATAPEESEKDGQSLSVGTADDEVLDSLPAEIKPDHSDTKNYKSNKGELENKATDIDDDVSMISQDQESGSEYIIDSQLSDRQPYVVKIESEVETLNGYEIVYYQDEYVDCHQETEQNEMMADASADDEQFHDQDEHLANDQLDEIDDESQDGDSQQDKVNSSEEIQQKQSKPSSHPACIDIIFTDEATEYNYSAKDEHQIPISESPTIATSFIESLTVHSVKDIIRKGISTHCLKIPPMPSTEERVITRKCSSQYTKNKHRNNDQQNLGYSQDEDNEDDDMLMDVDEAFIPKLQIEQVTSMANDSEPPVDLDDYVREIASVSFCEFSPFIGQPICKLCLDEPPVVLDNYTFLVQHTQEYHTTDSGVFECCLGDCDVFYSQAELNNHYFLVHGDIINAHTFLTCQTCDMGTESLVKFGKHVCFLDAQAEQPPVDNKYNCKTCDQNLISRRRSSFHQQFHLENARPKVCLVCDIVFRDEKTFYEHVMFSHDEFAQYFCRFCDKSFTMESELKRHEHSHTADRPFACDTCNKTFFDHQSLTTHKLIHQPGFTCEHCGQHYSRKTRLRKHILAAHVHYTPEVLPICVQCGQVFANEEKAERHWNTCQKINDSDTEAPLDHAPLTFEYFEKVLCCEFCEAAFEDLVLLLEHKKRHAASGLKFECQYCDYRFEAYSRLKTHSNAHPETKHPFPVKRLYVCEIDDCNKPYADWNNYQTHRKTVHLINPSIINCTECDAVFYKSWKYTYHKKSVHNEHHKCAFCDQTFVIERALKEHVQRFHQVNDEDMSGDEVDSNNDGSLRKTKQRKSKHAAVLSKYFSVNEVGDFYCLVCGKVTNRRSNAIAHAQMMHLKIRNFKCELCPKEFFHRGDLNGHMRKHNSETPYKCSHCDHAARNKSMLTLHLRKHTNERPFKCDQCPKAFKRSMVLKNHKKLHGEKELKCDRCGALFYTNYTLQNHYRIKHGNSATDGTTSKANRTPVKVPPSMIIVMPGPKQNDQRRKVSDDTASEPKNEVIRRVPPVTDHKSQKVYILTTE